MRIRIITYVILVLLVSTTCYAEQWIHNGPFGGYCTTIAIAPMENNRLYLPTEHAGVWMREDITHEWIPFSEGLPQNENLPGSYLPTLDYPEIRIFHLHPDSINTVIAVSGTNRLFFRSPETDVWTEQQHNIPEDESIWEIQWSYHNPVLVFITTLNTGQLTFSVWRSEDAGLTWERILEEENGCGSSIAAFPYDPLRVQAGRLVSHDGGYTWGIEDVVAYGQPLVVHPSHLGLMYRCRPDDWIERQLTEKSTNYGQSWQLLHESTATYRTPWMFLDAASNLLLFTDGASQVVSINTESDELDTVAYYNAMEGVFTTGAVTTPPLGEIFISTDKGIRLVIDNAQPIRADHGLVATSILDLSPGNSQSESFLAACTNGLFAYDSGQQSWIRQFEKSCEAVHATLTGERILAASNGRIFYSDNSGETWIDTEIQTYEIIAFEESSDLPRLIWATVRINHDVKVAYSTTNGATWIINNNLVLPEGNSRLVSHDLISQHLVISGSAPYRSFDNAAHWEAITLPEGNELAVDFVTGFSNTSLLYLLTESNLYRSEDFGTTWILYNQGLPQIPQEEDEFCSMVGLHRIPGNATGLIVAIQGLGLFQRTSPDGTWEQIEGPYSSAITNIALDENGSMCIGTDGHGAWVWQSEEYVTEPNRSESSLPSVVELSLPHPNPWNSSVKFSIQSPALQDAKISIYNLLGQCVRTLHRGIVQSGTTEFTWNGISDNGVSVASGWYMITLQTSTHVQSRKILLLQ